MDWPILRCRRWCGIALVAAVLAFTGPGAFAATERLGFGFEWAGEYPIRGTVYELRPSLP